MRDEEKDRTYAVEAFRYRDPLEVLVRAEARTCKGCAHERLLLGRPFCGKNKKHGTRCRLYIELAPQPRAP